MIDKTVLELVDRLVATTNRCSMVEAKLDLITSDLAATKAELEKVKEDYENCKEINRGLCETIKSKDNTISWGYNERVKVEKELDKVRAELKEFKDKQTEDESYHTSSVATARPAASEVLPS